MNTPTQRPGIDLEQQAHLWVVRVSPDERLSPRKKADHWADTCLDIVRLHPTGSPLFLLNDLAGMEYSLYGVRRAEGVFRTLPPNLTGAIATVHAYRTVSLLSEVFVGTLVKSRFPYLNLRVCPTVEEAVAWIDGFRLAVRA